MKSVGICSLGCKVNTYESEFVKNELIKAGYEIKDFSSVCDVYIINTCTVTNQSDSKSRKMINSAVRRNPNACIVAMGCFVSLNMDNLNCSVDIVIGNKDKSLIVKLLDEYFNRKEKIVRYYKDRLDTFEDMYIDDFPGRTRAFVKIQDGCDNFCSYCIIPYVRGKCRSKDCDKVISEVTSLVQNGYKEVVLTGIHTGNYGNDLDISFADLLKKLIKIDNLYRLRISSIEVTELNDEVLDLLKNSNILVDHLHIPLQAGSDFILKKMNRKYDMNYYIDKINKIRKIRPLISISTDVIVGFPYESDLLFNETIENCKKIGFSKIHVFPYSERKNTAASFMKEKISDVVKKERARKLIEVSKELEISYMNKFLGSKVEVLIENEKDGYSYGHTGNYLYVKIKGSYKSNSLVSVNIVDVLYPYCIGE